MSLLTVSNLSRSFGGLKAVDGVSFETNTGEILGLIGPNGAGKSTLFSLIAGAMPPTGGRLEFNGRDVTGWSSREATVAGVARTFQLMRVFGSMTVLENVIVGAHLRHRSSRSARRAATAVLEMTGMRALAEVLASTLTAASKKRLEVARSLATEPKLLLLDEVLSGLTPAEGQEAVTLIRDVRASGVTVIMVEHVMEIVMALSDRIVVLDRGRKISEGPPSEVAHDPAVVDAYLGEGSDVAAS